MTVCSSMKHNPIPHPPPPVNTWAPAENKKNYPGSYTQALFSTAHTTPQAK